MHKVGITTVALLWTAMCVAQGSGSGSSGQSGNAQSSSGSPSSADKSFIMKAAQDGKAEVQMGQLAQRNGSSQAVKQLGQTLQDDHQKANDQLQQIASSAGVQVPADTDSKHQAMAQKMQSMSGQQFDHMFLKQEIQDHQKSIAEFQKEANSGSDPQVKQFAQQQVPILQKHLQMAHQAEQSLGNGGSSSSSSSQ